MIARVSQIDKKTLDAAKVMGVTNVGMIYKIILPYCLIKRIAPTLPIPSTP